MTLKEKLEDYAVKSREEFNKTKEIKNAEERSKSIYELSKILAKNLSKELGEEFPDGITIDDYMSAYPIINCGCDYLARMDFFIEVNRKIQAPIYVEDVDINIKDHELGIRLIQGLNRENGSPLKYVIQLSVPLSHLVYGRTEDICALDLLPRITRCDYFNGIRSAYKNTVVMTDVMGTPTTIDFKFKVSKTEEWLLSVPKTDIFLPPVPLMTQWDEYEFNQKFGNYKLSEESLKEKIQLKNLVDLVIYVK